MDEKFIEAHAVDIEPELARVLHRVVRAMHDGECPKCHMLIESHNMRLPRRPDDQQARGFDLTCPSCGFTITEAEQEAVMKAFAPVMEKNLAAFEEWRAKRQSPSDAESGNPAS